jgi:hypothetical protein
MRTKTNNYKRIYWYHSSTHLNPVDRQADGYPETPETHTLEMSLAWELHTTYNHTECSMADIIRMC